MGYVAIADRDHEIEHHDPQTFITKYIWSQDHKVIAIQYAGTAIFVGVIAHIQSLPDNAAPDTIDGDIVAGEKLYVVRVLPQRRRCRCASNERATYGRND